MHSGHSCGSVFSEPAGLKYVPIPLFSPCVPPYVLNRFRAVHKNNGVFAEIYSIRSLRFFCFLHEFRPESEKKLKSRRNCPKSSVNTLKKC
jgi:hypothetical protein